MIMSIGWSLFCITMLYVVLPLMIWKYGRWLLAVSSILMGDKELLHDSNVCQKEEPWTPPKHQIDWKNKGEGNML